MKNCNVVTLGVGVISILTLLVYTDLVKVIANPERISD
jgi:hypothetical protein